MTKVHALTTSDVVAALGENARHPGWRFGQMFDDQPVWLRDGMLWLLAAGLLAHGPAALLFLAGNILLGAFFSAVYGSALRHEGLLLLYLLTLYWIVRQEAPRAPETGAKRWFGLLHKCVLFLPLTALLAVQVKLAFVAVRDDVRRSRSSSRAFAEFIAQHAGYRDAILVGEPDSRLESMPYYVDNRIYIPREGVFRRFVQFTSASRKDLSLHDLLVCVRELQDRERAAVLLALGHMNLAGRKTREVELFYGRAFTWSPEELAEFRSATIKVAEFTSVLTDEEYKIYVLR